MEQALSYDCRVHFYGAGKLIRLPFEIASLAGMCGSDCSSADSDPCLHACPAQGRAGSFPAFRHGKNQVQLVLYFNISGPRSDFQNF